MKKLLIIACAAAAVLAGCATSNETRKAEADAQVSIGNARVAEAQAVAEDARATQALAAKASQTGADNALLLRSLKALGLGQPAVQQVAQQAPQSGWGIAWQAALGIADVVLRGYGIKATRDASIVNSNNNRDVSIAGYGAFTSMGDSIRQAGTAGYQYVQAPGAVTNNSLSGTGVLGSGTYTGPVTTTTRNCAGGTSAPGGAGGGTDTAGTGGAGAAGGSATGGSC